MPSSHLHLGELVEKTEMGECALVLIKDKYRDERADIQDIYIAVQTLRFGRRGTQGIRG